jgi:4-hydroxybenzoyl-CoA thioesterase
VTDELLRTESSAALDRAYRSEVLVRFAHCDPAGIVFYPRYLEMFNNLVEDWCREKLALPFTELISSGRGLPTARIEVDFMTSSKMGDVLQARLLVRAIGKTSVRLEMVLRGADGQDRVRGKIVVVMTGAHGKGVPWPDDLRARLSQFLVAE